jgi:hypothetical protein
MSEPLAERDVLQQFLIGRDVSCPRCSYNLRDSIGVHCPECGVPLELHINSAYRRLGWWLFGLIALAVPFGFNLVLALIAGYGAYNMRKARWGWGDSDWKLLYILSGATVVAGIFIFMHSLRRGKFLRQPRRVQVITTIGTVLIAVALQVVVIVFFKRY